MDKSLDSPAPAPRPAPLVSVVLPTFNRARLLPRSIRSVLNQSFGDIELIVVDDASKDDTAEIVSAIHDPRLVYIRRSENGGVAAARNTGLSAARGRYVAFQDSDDEWLPDKLQLQMDSLERNNPATSVGMVVRMIGNSVKVWPPVGDGDDCNTPEWLLYDGVGYCQSLVVARDLVRGIGGFDEKLTMWEDWDLLLRLSRETRMIRCAGSWVISTRQSDSLTMDRSSFAEIQGSAVDKHADWLSMMPRSFARLQYVVGRRALEHGVIGEAIRRFGRSLSLNPLDPKAWLFMLRALGSALLVKRPGSPR